jgi:hypothetical protein
MASLTPELKKQLDIKRNVVTRITKELELYRQEAREETEKVASLKASDADPYDVKYAESILSEALAMVPDAEQRLRVAHADLQSFLDANDADIDTEELTTSRNLVRAALAACGHA